MNNNNILIPCIDIDVYDIDYDEYEHIGSTKKCFFCQYKLETCIDTFIHKIKKIVKTCILCNIILNFKSKYIQDCLVYMSDLDQNDINKKTCDFITKHKKFPSIKNIDKNAVRINISSFNFIRYLNNSDEYKKKCKCYKIFFSHSKIIYDFFDLSGYNCLSIIDNRDDVHEFFDDIVTQKDKEIISLHKINSKKIIKKCYELNKYKETCYEQLPLCIKK